MKLARRARADELLVGQGLARSTDEAQRLIMAGEVYAGSERIEKPGQLLAATTLLRVRESSRYVSRGGDKLAAALDFFAVTPSGRVCLDAGSSTGGFTDCLLQRGAVLVYAVDVGYGQLAWRLRNDSRVVVMERTNLRRFDPARLGPRPQLVVADLSFIALRTVLPVLASLPDASGDGELLLLVKPQFELPREQVPGGVVQDPALRARAAVLVEEAAADLAMASEGSFESPLHGPDGNREIFVLLRRHPNSHGCSR